MDKRPDKIKTLNILHLLVSIATIAFPVSYLVTKKPADGSLWLVMAILFTISAVLGLLKQNLNNKTE